MAEEDEDKTAFHTWKGIFCYIKMSFGLKNSSATYQHLIDSAFESQIGRNLEVYVHDLVIKSKLQDQMLQDIAKTFQNLRRINMKLNPSKCSFGEKEANEAFGSVLVAERDKAQKPIYFVSKALTGSEINYAPTEKFVYALLLTSRRLRRYFQGHPIHVLTDLPVKHVLNKHEVYGRLAKWAIELGSYKITYLPRTSVKGQVLADYLAKMTGDLEVIHERTELNPIQGETWNLFTDGASCAEGVGAGLILTSPSGEKHTYALRFNFDVTNNEAEYEAQLAGLNIALKLNIAKLRAYVDSQLVSNHFKGSFDAHELSMQKYLKLLKETAEKFEHFELAQISRSQNKKADALSKLEALTFSNFQKQVWVEELPSKAIDGSLVLAAVVEEQPNRMNPIINNLRNNILPEDKDEARLVHIRSPMYTTENDTLYRKSYNGPLMRCVGPAEAEMIIEEVHSGSCALHSGSFPAGAGNVKFLIVAIDYFTKWVEAKALCTITGVQVRNFVWEHIVCRFGIPARL
ncbi:uncharacterized protein [Rutidosis leptorrhynchoides]|uniref:uncharacterized protein n=1 Tax=Rutidosis leptorrhynchoides TaxID=125765 RepID=UPI003A9A1CFB